jgi:hypothetical protein
MLFGSYGAETKEKQPHDHTRPDSDAAEEASLSSKVDSFVRRTPSKKDSFVRRTPSTGLSIILCMHAVYICVIMSLPVYLFTPYPHHLVSRALLSRFDCILFVREANGSPTDSKRQEPCQSLAKGKAPGHFDATSNWIPRAYCPISVPGDPRAYCPLWCVSPLMQPLLV